MNNIITVLNREFSCEFLEAYDENDFKELSLFDENISLNDYNLLEKIDYFNFELVKYIKNLIDFESILICDEPLNVIYNKLSYLGIQSSFNKDRNTLYSHGFIASYIYEGNISVRIKVDPFMLATYVEFFNTVYEEIYGVGNVKRNWLNIVFDKNIVLETVGIKISSRLYSAGIVQLESHGGYFNFENIDFTIELKKDRRTSY